MGCVNAAEEFEKLKIIEDTNNFSLQKKSILYVVYLVASTCAFLACLFPFGKNSKVRTEAWKKGIRRCL